MQPVKFKISRGIRNNNPMNIVRGQPWRGLQKEQTDARFDQFLTPVFGLRAGMRVLLSYYYRHGLKTIRGMISRFAPDTENDTEAYIEAISRHLKIGADEILDIDDVLIPMTMMIVRHENGDPDPHGRPEFWYGMNVFEEAARMARN